MPSESDLNVANIAREAELVEQEESITASTTTITEQGINRDRSLPPPIGDDAPPGYTA